MPHLGMRYALRKLHMDTLSPLDRRRAMSAVKSSNTKPELKVRRLLFSNGYRYRLHRKDLPGCPDIVLPKYRTVIFVHGCFWHQHDDCPRSKRPASSTEYWYSKLQRNKDRDARHIVALKSLGWKVLIVWECQLKDLDAVVNTLRDFLQPSS